MQTADERTCEIVCNEIELYRYKFRETTLHSIPLHKCMHVYEFKCERYALCDYVMHARCTVQWCTNKLHSCSHAVPPCVLQNTVMHRQSTWFTLIEYIGQRFCIYSLICAQQMPVLWTAHKWALGAHIFQRKVCVLRSLRHAWQCIHFMLKCTILNV